MAKSEDELALEMLKQICDYGGLDIQQTVYGVVISKRVNNVINNGLRADLVLAKGILRKYLGMLEPIVSPTVK